MSKWIVDIHGEIEGDFDLICKAGSVIPLDKVKKVREKISENVYRYSGTGEEVLQGYCDGFNYCLKLIDNLIESEDK